MCVSIGHLWNRASRWGMAGLGNMLMPLVSRVGACEIQRLLSRVEVITLSSGSLQTLGGSGKGKS